MRYIAASSKQRMFIVHAPHYHHALFKIWSMFTEAAPKRTIYMHMEDEHVEFMWLNPEEDEAYDESFAVKLIDPRLLPEPTSLDDFRG